MKVNIYIYIYIYITYITHIPQIMIDQKQTKNVQYLNYLGSMITNDARCTREMKSRIATEKASFNKMKTLFTGKLDLNLRKETSKELHLEHSSVRC
jgi:hypothetical protein